MQLYNLVFSPQYNVSEQYLEISLTRFQYVYGNRNVDHRKLENGMYLVLCYGRDLADKIINAADKNGCLLMDEY